MKLLPVQLHRPLGTVGLCLAVTALSVVLKATFKDAQVELLLLSCVVVIAALLGRTPGILAAVLMATSYDWFFLPPTHSFRVSGPQLLSLGLLLGVALLVGHLGARLRQEAESAHRGQQKALNTAILARELSGAINEEQVLSLASRRVQDVFDQIPSFVTGTGDPARAPLSAVCIPLRAPRKVRGFLGLPEPLSRPEDHELLETWASLVALSLERIHFVDVARDALLRMEGEKMRGNILSTLSHDLRTPLTGIVAGAQRLLQELEPDGGERLGMASSILEESRRMTELVGNLLELSRLQSGGVKLRWEWNSVEELFASALRHRKTVLGGRQVSLEIPDPLSLFWCDGLLVERVLVNLLDNASRHTPPGTELLLWASETTDSVRIGLDDRGTAFVMDQRPRDAGRGGIGLSLCRAIAKAHSGELLLEPRPKGGNRVVLVLPRNRNPPEIPEDT
jgi:two-component system, OmpR family, sensor histidine kinase KdpD